MSNARRWYVYLTSAITLHSATWAIIALLRNLMIFGIQRSAVAFQVAVLIIGLPVFLFHWLWGQRLAEKEKAERGNTVRRLYLYGMMAGLLAPIATNIYDLIRRLFKEINPLQSRAYERLSQGDAILYHVIALVILSLIWFYLQSVTKEDSKIVPETGSSATVRRLYVLCFSATGLTMVTLGVIHLIRWVMLQFGNQVVVGSGLNLGLTNEITRLLVGVPLWIIFWRWAQRLYEGSDEERDSALRKFYLYSAVFVGAMDVIGWGTTIIAETLGKWIGAGPSSGDIRTPLPIIIGGGLLWAFHAFVLRDDANYEENTRQAGVRRLYNYLIAAIGFSALLLGLVGIVTILIQSIDDRDLLAYSISGIIVGLPVWLIPWRQLQAQAAEAGPKGDDARESTARKIYLYFFIFMATATALSCAVYIVYRLIDMMLGGKPPTLNVLAESIALIVISAAVWVYHGSILRGERETSEEARQEKLQAMRAVLLCLKEDTFEKALLGAVREEVPDLNLALLDVNDAKLAETLADTDLILGSWVLAISGGADGKLATKVAKAVTASSAHKLLLPTWHTNWDWAGVTAWQEEKLVQQTVYALKQLLDGKSIKIFRPVGAGTIILSVVGGIIILLILLATGSFFF